MLRTGLPHEPLIPGQPLPDCWRCPICLKKCANERGVTMHMIDKHKNPKHLEKITQWIANPTRTGLSQ